MTNRDMPVPKYSIGDKVWAQGFTTIGAKHECPDCLGEKTWVCKSRAGQEMEMDCPRCCGSSVASASDLSYTKYVPFVRQLTIGSVRIDTNERTNGPVSYMCKETGVGSGTIWREGQLHLTEDAATKASEIEMAPRQAESASSPVAMERARLAKEPYLYALESRIRREVYAEGER